MFPIFKLLAVNIISLGRHSCLFCLITKDEMKISRNNRNTLVQQSLTTLCQDLTQFQDNGSNLKKAKFHNNVIGDYLFEVPLDQVEKIIYNLLRTNQ